MKKKRTGRILAALALALSLICTLPLPALAAPPRLEEVEYRGNGIVEVEFLKKVSYKDAKVTVTGDDGKICRVSVTAKDKDDLTFKIRDYQEGASYTFTISGVRRKGTKKYGSVSGTVTIPAPPKTVSKKRAMAMALDHAQKTLGASAFREKEIEKDSLRGVPVWDIEFRGKIGGRWYEFDYEIERAGGKILRWKYERD